MTSRDEELLAQHIREAMLGTLAVVLVGELHSAFRAERERWTAEMAAQQRDHRKVVAKLEAERDRAENELAVERSCKYDAELARDKAITERDEARASLAAKEAVTLQWETDAKRAEARGYARAKEQAARIVDYAPSLSRGAMAHDIRTMQDSGGEGKP